MAKPPRALPGSDPDAPHFFPGVATHPIPFVSDVKHPANHQPSGSAAIFVPAAIIGYGPPGTFYAAPLGGEWEPSEHDSGKGLSQQQREPLFQAGKHQQLDLRLVEQ